MATEKIRVGSRRSPLALAQTNIVINKLKAENPGLGFEIRKIRTEGDEDYRDELGAPARGKDAFTRRIEQELLSGEIDMAVHSLKDLPSKLHPELVIGAVPEREDPRDALVSVNNVKLKDLPKGAKVGTSSLRRRAQLLAFRPDIEVVELRGNIGTRISKMYERGLDAAILASAGLIRLGMSDRITEIIPLEIMLPEIGQGALAVQVRRRDGFMLKIASSIDDRDARLATEAERALSERLGGGCDLPVAAYGRVSDGRLILEGMVASADGRRVIREKIVGEVDDPGKVGRLLAERMLALGAAEMVGRSA